MWGALSAAWRKCRCGTFFVALRQSANNGDVRRWREMMADRSLWDENSNISRVTC